MRKSPEAGSEPSLQVLDEACQRGGRARLVLQEGPGKGITLSTRLLALTEDGVYLQRPQDEALRKAPPNAAVEVYFESEGRRYAFQARLHPPEAQTRARPGAPLRVTRPERLERRQQREAYRVMLTHTRPVRSHLKRLSEPVCAYVRLTDLSLGGFRAEVPSGLAAALKPEDRFEARLELPGESEELVFVVRFVHREEIDPENPYTSVGWAFCPEADPAGYRRHQARLQRFVAAEQRELLKRGQPVDANRR